MARRATDSRQRTANESGTSPGEFETFFARIQAALPAIETQRDLADLLDIRQSSVSDAKRRQVVPGEWAIKLLRSHQLNPLWIYDGLEPVRISGMADTSSPDPAALRDSFLLRYNLPKIMVVAMEDASMEPAISRNAYVGVNSEDRKLVSDTVFAFRLPPEGFILRRVMLKPADDHVEMRAERPTIPHTRIPLHQARQHVLGRVVWVMQAPRSGTLPVNAEDKRHTFD